MCIMNKDYSKYDSIKFSTDNYFLLWRISDNKESAKFWNSFMEKHPEKNSEIQAAIRIINSIHINDYKFTQEESASEWQLIESSVQKPAKRVKKMWIALVVASSIALLIWSHHILNEYLLFDTLKTDTSIKPDKNEDILLVLGNNSSMSFDQNAYITYDNAGNVVISNMTGEKVLRKKNIVNDVLLNKLIVPKGKRSSLVLSDGSKIWINSGSTLEFPSKFEKNKREIDVNGEIYIEVVKDRNKPFIVNTSKFKIEVLGTKFNVSAYNEDKKHEVALVDGSVKIITDQGNSVEIKPNELLTISRNSLMREYVDIYNYISWKDGIFKFTSEPLENIMLRLSRYYDISIDCTNDIRDIDISGKLVLFDDPETVLNNISIIVPVKYKKEGGKLIFSKKQ